jgi:predicted transcriptional regulator
LVLDGEVEAYTHNGYQRLFPKDFPPSWRMVVSALRGASALRVMNEIHKGPRTINDLSEATGLAKSTVSKQIQKLRSLGIAIPISYSGRTHYSPSGDRKITDLVTIGKKGLNSAVDHYLEMWEF